MPNDNEVRSTNPAELLKLPTLTPAERRVLYEAVADHMSTTPTLDDASRADWKAANERQKGLQ